jgi:hypothetical protein
VSRVRSPWTDRSRSRAPGLTQETSLATAGCAGSPARRRERVRIFSDSVHWQDAEKPSFAQAAQRARVQSGARHCGMRNGPGATQDFGLQGRRAPSARSQTGRKPPPGRLLKKAQVQGGAYHCGMRIAECGMGGPVRRSATAGHLGRSGRARARWDAGRVPGRTGCSKRPRCKAAREGPSEAYWDVRRSARQSAPTPQMGLFQQPARRRRSACARFGREGHGDEDAGVGRPPSARRVLGGQAPDAAPATG